MKLNLSILALTVTCGIGVAQNGELNFVHGIPTAGPVDLAINGATVISGATFGTVQSATVAPGTYTVDVVQGGNVLLSETATIAADENFTAAAHLVSPLLGGGASLSVFQNDLSAVSVFGEGRLTIRHLAEADFMFFTAEAQNALSLVTLAPVSGFELPTELVPADYNVQAAPIDISSGVINVPVTPFPSPSTSTGPLALAADAGIAVNFVGVPGTPSFIAIVENFTLEPATAVTPNLCDLTVSGSLLNGSLRNGGDINFDLTNATPNSFVVFFLADDNTPSTFFNINLGIGGSGVIPFGFGTADATGSFSTTWTFGPVVIPPIPGLPPIPNTPIPIDMYAQAVSVDFGSASLNFNLTCVSDVESFRVNL